MKKLILLLSLPLLGYAITLSEILEGVAKNGLIQSSKLSTQAQKHAYEATKSAYWPSLKAQAAYSYVAESERSFIDTQYSGALTASLVLFDGFKRGHLIDAQKQRYEAMKAYSKQTLQEISLQAVTLFFNLRSLQSSMEATRQKIEQLKREVQRLERLFSVRNVREDELEEMKAAQAMAEYELLKQQQESLTLSYTLQTLTGKEITQLGRAHFTEPKEPSQKVSFDIQAKRFETQALKHQAEVQTASYWPTLLLRDTLSGTQYYASELSLGATTFTLPETTNKVELVASLTLVDFGAQSQQRQKLYLQHKAKASELAYKEQEIDHKRKLAHVQLQTARAKIASAELTLKASKKSYEFRKRGFKANLLDSTVYLDALTRYFEAKALYDRSQNDYEVAKASYYFYYAINLKEKLQ